MYSLKCRPMQQGPLPLLSQGIIYCLSAYEDQPCISCLMCHLHSIQKDFLALAVTRQHGMAKRNAAKNRMSQS